MDIYDFKVGDKVERVDDGSKYRTAALPGATATIQSIDIDSNYLIVKWDRNDLDKEQMDGSYSPGIFKLATNNKAVKGHFNKVTVETVPVVPGMQFKKGNDSSTVYFVNDKYQMIRVKGRYVEEVITDVRQAALTDTTWQLVDNTR